MVLKFEWVCTFVFLIFIGMDPISDHPSEAENVENTGNAAYAESASESASPSSTDVPRGELVMNLLPEAQLHLNAIRKWTHFFAVMGYIFIGLFLVVGVVIFATVTQLENINGIEPEIIGLVYLLMAGLYIYPVAKLLEFSTRMKNALGAADDKLLNTAFHSLRQHFGFVGWSAIAMMILYFLLILVFAVMGSY